MKPLQQLWTVAHNYVRIFEQWTEGNFYELNADEMDDNITEWWKQLQRVSKTNVAEMPQPNRLLTHLLNSIEEFKQYMPMVSALRMKGLDKRHWQMLSKQIGVELDPSNLQLHHLIKAKLHEGHALETIKGVSEIAIKEYAIKTTLDSLDNEMRVMEF
jgi:dynein heavy chain